MSCRGICTKHKAKKPYLESRYNTGQKRCNACDVFINWDGVRCPCCGCVLRTRTRNTRHRLRLIQEIKRI